MAGNLTKGEVIDIALQITESMRANFVPNPATRYKTSSGNMAFNALRYEIEGDELVIYIDEDIAPYVYYTNEPWLSPRWKGKANPNQGWWDNDFVPEFVRRLTAALGGTISV